MLETAYPHVVAGPPKPSTILTPASVSAHSGYERYEVQGGGAILAPVSTGDRITLRNIEGGQLAEIVAADAQGRIDAGLIGLPSNSHAAGLKALLADTAHRGSGLGGLRLGLERRGIDLAKAEAVAMFGGSTLAGTTETVTAQRDGVLVIAAPGGPMLPDGQDTATPIGVEIQRAKVSKRATSSRSSMWMVANAPTFNASRHASSIKVLSTRST